MSLEEKFTNPSCYCGCEQFKPTIYTFTMNLTITSDLECIFHLIVALLLTITFYFGANKINLKHQKIYQTYYLLIILIYICHTLYSIQSWVFHSILDTNKLYFNQRISYYLVDQADILLNSFYLSVAFQKIQDLDEFSYKRIVVRMIEILNIIYTLAFTIWLTVVVFYYNLCFEQMERYQKSQLILTSICSLSTIFILSHYVKQRREQVDSISSLMPLILFIASVFIGSMFEILMLVLRFKAEAWLYKFKYDQSLDEIAKGKFQDVIEFKIYNTNLFSYYDFAIYLFTVWWPLTLFVYMYSNARRIFQQNQMIQTID